MTMQTSARQNVRVAVETIKAADLANGVTTSLFTKLPNGVIPLAMSTLIVTPFNPGTSELVDIGVAGGAEYFNDVDFEAVAGTRVNAAALPGLINDAAGGVQLTAKATIVGAAPTVGEALVILQYAEYGVEHGSQG